MGQARPGLENRIHGTRLCSCAAVLSQPFPLQIPGHVDNQLGGQKREANGGARDAPHASNEVLHAQRRFDEGIPSRGCRARVGRLAEEARQRSAADGATVAGFFFDVCGVAHGRAAATVDAAVVPSTRQHLLAVAASAGSPGARTTATRRGRHLLQLRQTVDAQTVDEQPIPTHSSARKQRLHRRLGRRQHGRTMARLQRCAWLLRLLLLLLLMILLLMLLLMLLALALTSAGAGVSSESAARRAVLRGDAPTVVLGLGCKRQSVAPAPQQETPGPRDAPAAQQSRTPCNALVVIDARARARAPFFFRPRPCCCVGVDVTMPHTSNTPIPPHPRSPTHLRVYERAKALEAEAVPAVQARPNRGKGGEPKRRCTTTMPTM
eukprot:246807-Chlamydomonas_euryale.AAC.2